MKGSRPLSQVEIEAVARSFSGGYAQRNRALFLLGIYTGMRISELLALNVGDVWVYSKPVEMLHISKEMVKGKKEARMVPFSSKAQMVIRDLIPWKESRGESLSTEAPLFASRNNGQRLSRFQAHLILRDAFFACRLSGKVTTHSMRKTFGTRLYAATKNMMLVKELLGHKSIATTQKYIGVGIDEMIQAVELL